MGAALETYTPDTTYQGQLLLFLAADSLWKEADWRDSGQRGWQAVCEQPIEVHLVPGNHISFLKAPNVAQVAELLRASRVGWWVDWWIGGLVGWWIGWWIDSHP